MSLNSKLGITCTALMPAIIMKHTTYSRRAFVHRLIGVSFALRAGVATGASPGERRAVELTFLKSTPGQREQLKSFIVLNWFAMDKIAKEQGLLSSYTVMDTGTDDGAWNVLVSTTYKDDRGLEGVADAFEKIRQAHKPVPVDGKGLRHLGTIVDSKRMFENAAHASR